MNCGDEREQLDDDRSRSRSGRNQVLLVLQYFAENAGDSLRPRIPKGARIGFHKQVLGRCIKNVSSGSRRALSTALPPVSLPHSPCLTLAIDSIPAADAGFRRFALRSDSLRGRRTRTRGTGANREDRKNGIVVNSQRSCAYGFILEIYFRIEKKIKNSAYF